MRVLIRRLCRSLGQAELLAGRRVRDDALAPEVLVGLPKLLHELVARILADLVLRLVDLALLVLEELDVVELDLEVAGFAEADERGDGLRRALLAHLAPALGELVEPVRLVDLALGVAEIVVFEEGSKITRPVLDLTLLELADVELADGGGALGKHDLTRRGGGERERQGPDGEAARHRWRGQAAGRRGGEV